MPCRIMLGEMTEVPFADAGGPIAEILQRLADRRLLGVQPGVIIDVERRLQADPRRVTTSHQCRSRRGTDRCRSIKGSQPRSLACDAVQIRRGDRRRPETPQVPVTLVVGQDQHKVRAIGSMRTGQNQNNQYLHAGKVPPTHHRLQSPRLDSRTCGNGPNFAKSYHNRRVLPTFGTELRVGPKKRS